MEIDKRTRRWRPEDNKMATPGNPDCPHVLHRDRRLIPRVLASKSATRVTSFLASQSHMVCQYVRIEVNLLLGRPFPVH